MKKIIILTLIILLSKLVLGQISFIGFDTTICADPMTNLYTYENWSSGESPSSSESWYSIFKNGIQVYSAGGSMSMGKTCNDLIFINDSVGFKAIWSMGYKLYKTVDYGESWILFGIIPEIYSYMGTYIINEHYAYCVAGNQYNVYVGKCSDIGPLTVNNLIVDNMINAPIYITDTILNNSLCNNDSLKIFINNNTDTITYYINFSFLSTGVLKDKTCMNSIKLYPNPTNGRLTIEGNNIERIDIYNSNGVLIKSSIQNDIDISKQVKGIYIIKIVTKNGIEIRKVLLE